MFLYFLFRWEKFIVQTSHGHGLFNLSTVIISWECIMNLVKKSLILLEWLTDLWWISITWKAMLSNIKTDHTIEIKYKFSRKQYNITVISHQKWSFQIWIEQKLLFRHLNWWHFLTSKISTLVENDLFYSCSHSPIPKNPNIIYSLK